MATCLGITDFSDSTTISAQVGIQLASIVAQHLGLECRYR